jgi:hypothetical protein
VGVVAVTALFISTALLTWAKSIPLAASAICTLILLVVYTIMVIEGRRTYALFLLPEKYKHNGKQTGKKGEGTRDKYGKIPPKSTGSGREEGGGGGGGGSGGGGGVGGGYTHAHAPDSDDEEDCLSPARRVLLIEVGG